MKSHKGRKQQKQTSVSQLQTGLKWATEAHQLHLFADVPAVSISHKRLCLLFSFLSDEMGGFAIPPHPIQKQQSIFIPAPYISTYLSFLFCPFCFPAKLLNSSSVGCWYQRRLSTQADMEREDTKNRWNNHKHQAKTSRLARNSSELNFLTAKNLLEVFFFYPISGFNTHLKKNSGGYLFFRPELEKAATSTLRVCFSRQIFQAHSSTLLPISHPEKVSPWKKQSDCFFCPKYICLLWKSYIQI